MLCLHMPKYSSILKVKQIYIFGARARTHTHISISKLDKAEYCLYEDGN